jgi:hypothetical protein
VFYTGAAAALYSASCAFRAKDRKWFLLGLAGVVMGGIALSAVQLFTGLMESRETARSAGLSYALAAKCAVRSLWMGAATCALLAVLLFLASIRPRAVPLAAGHHPLCLEYRPTGFLIGRWISLASLVVYLGLLWFSVGQLVSGRLNCATRVARSSRFIRAPVT